MGAEFSLAGRRTDMTKLIVGFHTFANAPKVRPVMRIASIVYVRLSLNVRRQVPFASPILFFVFVTSQIFLLLLCMRHITSVNELLFGYDILCNV